MLYYNPHNTPILNPPFIITPGNPQKPGNIIKPSYIPPICPILVPHFTPRVSPHPYLYGGERVSWDMGRWSGAWAWAKVLGSERLKAVCVKKDGPSLIVVWFLGGGVFKSLGGKATFLSIWIKVVVVPRSYILWCLVVSSGVLWCLLVSPRLPYMQVSSKEDSWSG